MILETKQQKELKDETKWPQTQQVFEAPKIEFDKHQWRQEGYDIIDTCPNCPKQSIPIGRGKMLVRVEGRYNIVDELRS